MPKRVRTEKWELETPVLGVVSEYGEVAVWQEDDSGIQYVEVEHEAFAGLMTRLGYRDVLREED